jgi:hypothetical protein
MFGDFGAYKVEAMITLLLLALLPLDVAIPPPPRGPGPLLSVQAPKEPLHAGVWFSVDLRHTNMTGRPMRLRTSFRCQTGAEDILIVDGVEQHLPFSIKCGVMLPHTSTFGSPGAFVTSANVRLSAGRHQLQMRYTAAPLGDGAWTGSLLSEPITVDVLP